jgi:hypothetical protein
MLHIFDALAMWHSGNRQKVGCQLSMVRLPYFLSEQRMTSSPLRTSPHGRTMNINNNSININNNDKVQQSS